MRNRMKFYCIAALCVLFSVLTGCAGHDVITRTFPQEKILSLEEVQALPKRSDPNQYVIALQKGDVIPILLHIDSDLVHFGQDHIDLVLKEPLYFRVQVPQNMTEAEWKRLEELESSDFAKMDKQEMEAFLEHYMLYVSRDALHWAPLNSIDACKEVLHIKGGEFSVGLTTSSASGVKASIFLKIHPTETQ